MLLIAALLLVSTGVVECRTRIIGGFYANIRMLPYMGSMQLDGQHLCGCAVLNETTMITAAHCIRFDPTAYTIRVGSTNYKSGGQLLQVSDIKVHPNYTRSDGDSDVAIILLKDRIIFDGTVVRPVTPAPKDYVLEDDTLLRVNGWGTTLKTDRNAVSETLKSTVLSVMNKDECISRYPPNSLTDNMFCAQSFNMIDDSCSGDSGGPAVTFEGLLVGVVSWGLSCSDYVPGIYANFMKMVLFISQYYDLY